MRIVVLGYIVRGPLGGLCWHHLQYLLGLRQLGHEVLFLEDSDNYPSCYNPEMHHTTAEPSYGIRFITTLFKNYQLQHNWAYYDEHTNEWHGMPGKEVANFCKTADMVFNISNVNPIREWWVRIPRRILIDTDPAFTQIKHLEEKRHRIVAEHHTHFFSFGENFGNPGCGIPDDGFNWMPTHQPVVLDAWDKGVDNPGGSWTTVMQWNSYNAKQFNGVSFGMKSASFDEYFDLPAKVDELFELAVGSDSAPLEKLEKAGWKITNPLEITLTAKRYQQYLRESKGEFSIAKQGYVVSNSGWFSERSAGYLASGRPVIAQDTGFSKLIESGRGLFPFSSLEEAIAAVEAVNSDYPKHCRYARELAEEYFNASKVLTSMLDRLNDPPAY